MAVSRFESYKKFTQEAKDYEYRISKSSVKNESKVKYNKNKNMTKISSKKRTKSRKTMNQNVDKEEI